MKVDYCLLLFSCLKEEIKPLIANATLEKTIQKSCGQRYDREVTFIKMKIPNIEIRTIYKNTVQTWFNKKVESKDLRPLIKAMENGNCRMIEEIINDQLMDTISFFDYQESCYHDFLAALLQISAKDYSVRSNRESGMGWPDLIAKTRQIRGGRVFILEKGIDRKKQESLHSL